MSSILLDSSVIVDFLRVKDKGATLFKKIIDRTDRLYISIITHTELFAGKSAWERPEAQEDLQNILSEMDILPLDENLSLKAGEIRAKYDLHIADAITAATASKYGLELATLNIKDFKKIKGLKLAKIPKMTLEN